MPPQFRKAKSRALLLGLACIALLIAVFAAGYGLGRKGAPEQSESTSRPASVFSRPGPWGELEYLPITLTPPEEILHEREFVRSEPRWKLPGFTREKLSALLTNRGENPSSLRAWLAPTVLRETGTGIVLSPSCGQVQALGDSTRKDLYEALALQPENLSWRWQFLARHVTTFRDYGVPEEVVRNVVANSVRHGRFLVNYAMPCALPEGAPRALRYGLLKGLTQQPSRIVRLHVTPKMNLPRRVEYWGLRGQVRKVRPLFESLYALPTGGSVDLSELLPPMPAALLHSYETSTEYTRPFDTPKNCSWTAMNFFNELPKIEFVDAGRTIEVLKRDYEPVVEPRYGDVAVFFTPSMDMVHVATYLADDLYFTKNGANELHPWVVNSGVILLQYFSFGLPEGQTLTIRHFRQKGP